MRKTVLTMTAAAMMAAGSLMAGGFWLQLGNPEASPEASKANAVVTMIAAGCSDPAKAEITATAIGTVEGKRKSIPLSVIKLSKPGMFAIAQQWPKEGNWVIQLEGRSDGHVTSTLVTAGPKGVDRLHAKSEMRAFALKEVESLLQ
jgi:hypothetical protein